MITREQARCQFDLLSDSERAVYYKSAAYLKERYLKTSMSEYELARNIYVNRTVTTENNDGREEKS